MSDQTSPEQVDDEFFGALSAGDVSRLEPLLDERFRVARRPTRSAAWRVAPSLLAC
jgi:hypothetical protein